MWLVGVAWSYVVVMMTIAEATSDTGTVLGALVTFVLYGVLPLSIVLYLVGTPGRRRRRAAAMAVEGSVNAADPSSLETDVAPSTTSLQAADGPASDEPASALDPDRGRHAPGDSIAPERKEA